MFPPPAGTWQGSLVLDSSFLTCLTALMPTPASENDASCERCSSPYQLWHSSGVYTWVFSVAGFAAIILPQSLLASGCTTLEASVTHIIDLESGCLSSVLFLILRGGVSLHGQ